MKNKLSEQSWALVADGFEPSLYKAVIEMLESESIVETTWSRLEEIVCKNKATYFSGIFIFAYDPVLGWEDWKQFAKNNPNVRAIAIVPSGLELAPLGVPRLSAVMMSETDWLEKLPSIIQTVVKGGMVVEARAWEKAIQLRAQLWSRVLASHCITDWLQPNGEYILHEHEVLGTKLRESIDFSLASNDSTSLLGELNKLVQSYLAVAPTEPALVYKHFCQLDEKIGNWFGEIRESVIDNCTDLCNEVSNAVEKVMNDPDLSPGDATRAANSLFEVISPIERDAGMSLERLKKQQVEKEMKFANRLQAVRVQTDSTVERIASEELARLARLKVISHLQAVAFEKIDIGLKEALGRLEGYQNILRATAIGLGEIAKETIARWSEESAISPDVELTLDSDRQRRALETRLGRRLVQCFESPEFDGADEIATNLIKILHDVGENIARQKIIETIGGNFG